MYEEMVSILRAYRPALEGLLPRGAWFETIKIKAPHSTTRITDIEKKLPHGKAAIHAVAKDLSRDCVLVFATFRASEVDREPARPAVCREQHLWPV